MSKLFNFPLNLQLFAEPGEPGGSAGGEAGGQGGTTVPEIDYEKMAEAIEKRTKNTTDNVLVGYLKQQGLTGEELTKAVNTYKAQKAQKATQHETEFENYKTENAQLKAQILNSNIDSKLMTLAAAEGVSADKIPFLSKLIERNGLADEKGNVLEDKVKEAMNTVLKAFPDFKGTQQQGGTGFQQIGGAGNNQNTNTVDDQLDAIFGIKKK